MSANLYDTALVNKLQDVAGDSRIRIVPPENATAFLAQIDKDNVSYPAILLKRTTVQIVEEARNQYAMLKGQTAKYNADDNTVTKARVIPVRINWDIDVYAADRNTCDEIVRELVWFFTVYPRFTVKIPYGLDIEQNFDIMLDPEIVDNTDLLGFDSTGELFRETLSVHTENAHFYSAQRQYLTKVKPDVENIN